MLLYVQVSSFHKGAYIKTLNFREKVTLDLGTIPARDILHGALQHYHCSVSQDAQRMLKKVSFSTVRSRIETGIISVEDLGFPHGANLMTVWSSARDLNLEEVSSEVPLHMFIQKKEVLMGKRIIAMMDPLLISTSYFFYEFGVTVPESRGRFIIDQMGLDSKEECTSTFLEAKQLLLFLIPEGWPDNIPAPVVKNIVRVGRRPRGKRKDPYTEDFLLAEIRKAYEILGKIPNTMDIGRLREEGKIAPSYQQLIIRFEGGWKGVLTKAGVIDSNGRASNGSVYTIKNKYVAVS